MYGTETPSLRELSNRLVQRAGQRVLEADLRHLCRCLHDPLAANVLLELANTCQATTWGDLVRMPVAETSVSAIGPVLWGQVEREVLRWAEERRRVRPRGTALSAGIPGPPDQMSALLRWAAEHRVEDCLDHPVERLLPWVSNNVASFLRQSLSSASVRHCLSTPVTAAHAHFRPYVDSLRAAARAYVWHQAGRRRIESVRQGLWCRPLGSPRLTSYARRLRETLEILRRLPGVEAPVVFADAPVSFEEEPPTLVVEFHKEDRSVPDGSPVITRLPLEQATAEATGKEPPLRMTCTCSLGRTGGCAHRRVVLEWTLDMLFDERDPHHPALVELAGKPDWSRVLEQMQRPEDDVGADEAAASEIVWRLGGGQGAELRVQPALRRRAKNGRWGRGRQLSPRQLLETEADLLDTRDRNLAATLSLAELSESQNVRSVLLATALEGLVGHPRVFALERPRSRLAVERAPLGLHFRDAGASYALSLRLGSSLVPAAEVSGYRLDDRALAVVEADQNRCVLVSLGERAKELVQVLERCDARFPPESHAALLDVLMEYQPEVEIDAPAELAGQIRPAVATPVLRLEPLAEGGLSLSLWVRPAGRRPQWSPGQGPVVVFAHEGDQRFSVTRDFGTEQRLAQQLANRLELTEENRRDIFRWEFRDQQQALDVLGAVRALGEEVPVEWPARCRPWQVSRVSAADLRVRVTRCADWFGVEGEADAEGQHISFEALLRAARSGVRYVSLAPGQFVQLEDSLRGWLGQVDQVVHSTGRSGLCLNSALAAEATSLLGECGNLAVDQTWQLYLQRAREAQELEPPVPAGLAAELRSYQREGFRWLARLAHWARGTCLADDMGLGKTIQALALLLHRRELGPALVVAPTSVGAGWSEEAGRFAPSLRVLVYRGPQREAILADLQPGDMVVTSYDLLALDIEKLAERSFATLVLDEAQAIKNPNTQRARAACRVKADFRLALSGTPLENHLGEVWSIFQALMPDILGSWEVFAERFALPIERDGDAAAQKNLSRLLRPFLLRRTKAEVAPELPPRTEVVQPVELSAAERSLYAAARREALAQLGEQSSRPPGPQRMVMLAALTRLRQLACHPRLIDPDATLPSAKLGAVLRWVEQFQEHDQRALIFSQFTRHLALLREALDYRGVSYRYLDGQTPTRRRAREVHLWQEGQGRLFLISLKAGGTGLNLTGADYVIHLDPWWNPAVEDQASDRSHRIGQTRPLTVVRLISQGTIEEAVLGLHARKRELARSLLEGTRAAQALSWDELWDLLAWGDQAGANEPQVQELGLTLGAEVD